ncbi:MAG TPA: peptidase U32, partial [Clostridiales bacterium]|nr:peptidase U32 [Clostridiales bacterium]
KGMHFNVIAKNMQDGEGNTITSAPHPQMTIKMEISENVEPYYILRKKTENDQ